MNAGRILFGQTSYNAALVDPVDFRMTIDFELTFSGHFSEIYHRLLVTPTDEYSSVLGPLKVNFESTAM